jgi:tRNA 2-thiouridine synthesizing protein A
MEFDKEIDTSGLSCPLPVIKAKKALKAMEIGQVLKVLTTDPGSKKDMPAWARMTGQEILGDEEDGKLFTFYVKRNK